MTKTTPGDGATLQPYPPTGSPSIDVATPPTSRRASVAADSGTRATLWGLVVGVLAVAAATASLLPFRHGISRATPALVFVLPVVAAGLIGRRLAAVATAVAAAAVFSFSFVPPYDHVSIAEPEDFAALIVFLVVALVVGALVATEIDRRHAAEVRSEEIQRLFDRNEQLVAERERLREEASRVALVTQLAEQRSALLRSVSHDLRTPLATIQAVASDLRDGTVYAPETRDDLLDLVSDEAARLNRMVANLLSMSRIETGSLAPHRQAIAVDELLSDRLRQLDRVLAGRAIHLDLSTDLPHVDADYTQLEQVITNLLENAARHTPPGSPIQIQVRLAGPMMAWTFSDEGPGIPAEEQEAVFEPFHRGASSSSSGVGLAICKAIIEAHGGEIWLDPTTSGTRIAFTIPLHP